MATIQGVYVALFGRPADPGGLAFYNEATGGGADLTPIIGNLTASAEFQARFAGQTNAEIINSIYQSIFGREAEPEGLAFFLGELQAGRQTLETIAINILDGAQGSDVATLAAKLEAADLFTARLDLEIEINAYVGNDAAAIGRAFLAGVDAENPTTIAATDAAILLLFGPDPDEVPAPGPGAGSGPGGGGGGGGGGPAPGGDTTPPDAPTISGIAIIEGQVIASGLAEAGATVTFAIGGQSFTTIATDEGWAINEALPNGLELPGPSYSVVAIATDAAGNASAPSDAYLFVYDNVAPSQPTIAEVSVEDGTVSATGSTEPNSTVRIFIDGADTGMTVLANEQGQWSFSASVDSLALEPGTFNMTVTAMDGSGNVSIPSDAQDLIYEALSRDPIIYELTPGSFYEITDFVIDGDGRDMFRISDGDVKIVLGDTVDAVEFLDTNQDQLVDSPIPSAGPNLFLFATIPSRPDLSIPDAIEKRAIIEFDIALDESADLSLAEDGSELLKGLRSDAGAKDHLWFSGISGWKGYIIAYDNDNAYIYHGDAGVGIGFGPQGFQMVASEMKLVGVLENVQQGALTYENFIA